MFVRRPLSKRIDGPARDPLALSTVFLHFAPAIQDRFERDTGEERCRHLRRSIIVGLLFYNAYNFSDFMLIPDVAIFSTAARLFVMTPIGLALVWCIPRLTPTVREAAITVAMVGVVAVPVVALAASRASFAGYTLAEVPLVLIYGGMMLVLRVQDAARFTLASAIFTAVAIVLQPAFVGLVTFAVLLQLVTACAFVLYGNRQIEWVRRSAYLAALRETLRSERLEEARLKLTALSATDALTGLANRRAFDEALSLHEVSGLGVALIMIDIDYFKAFNDMYGHAAGDGCLRAVSAALAKVCRPEDLVARFGGEEFAVIVENAGPPLLQAVMHRLCAEVRGLPIPHEGRPDGKTGLTVSAGGAILTATAPGAARELIDRADEALYAAKRRGRDCYGIAGMDYCSRAA